LDFRKLLWKSVRLFFFQKERCCIYKAVKIQDKAVDMKKQYRKK